MFVLNTWKNQSVLAEHAPTRTYFICWSLIFPTGLESFAPTCAYLVLSFLVNHCNFLRWIMFTGKSPLAPIRLKTGKSRQLSSSYVFGQNSIPFSDFTLENKKCTVVGHPCSTSSLRFHLSLVRQRCHSFVLDGLLTVTSHDSFRTVPIIRWRVYWLPSPAPLKNLLNYSTSLRRAIVGHLSRRSVKVMSTFVHITKM